MRLTEAPSVVAVIGLAAILGAIMLSILTNLQGTFTANSSAYNATSKAIEGIGKIYEQFPLVGTVVGFALVLGIVVVLWYAFGRPGAGA